MAAPKQNSDSTASAPGACHRRHVRRSSARYVTEKIEAYNVAIEALRMHESADPDPDGLDRELRERLADKLEREIQRWVNSLPNVDVLAPAGEKTPNP